MAQRTKVPTPPRPKLSFGRWWTEVGWRHVVGVLASLYALFPVCYIVSASLNPLGTVVSTSMIPRSFSLVNFEALFNTPRSRSPAGR